MRASARRARLRNGEHLGILQTRKVPYDIWSPVAVTNYTEIYDVSPPSKTADDCEYAIDYGGKGVRVLR